MLQGIAYFQPRLSLVEWHGGIAFLIKIRKIPVQNWSTQLTFGTQPLFSATVEIQGIAGFRKVYMLHLFLVFRRMLSNGPLPIENIIRFLLQKSLFNLYSYQIACYKFEKNVTFPPNRQYCKLFINLRTASWCNTFEQTQSLSNQMKFSFRFYSSSSTYNLYQCSEFFERRKYLRKSWTYSLQRNWLPWILLGIEHASLILLYLSSYYGR